MKAEYTGAVAYGRTGIVDAPGYKGNNCRGLERLPARAYQEDLNQGDGIAKAVSGVPLIHPLRWYTEAIHPSGNVVSYALTNGCSDIPVQPIYGAAVGTYQWGRIQKAYACGFLLTELGCLQRQRALTRMGIPLVRDSRIVARELLGRPECPEGEPCSCFEIETAARRSKQATANAERQAEYDSANPAVRQEKTLEQLTAIVEALSKDAISAAKKGSKQK